MPPEAEERDGLARERPLPSDHERERASEEEEDQAGPKELFADDFVIDRKNVLPNETRRLRVNGLKVDHLSFLFILSC